MPEGIRRARTSDLPGLVELERLAFQPWRRSTPRSLRRSLASPRQSVWLVDGPPHPSGAPAAAMVLWHHPRTVRVYGIATRPDMQGHGLGRALMRHAESLAPQRVVLEADAGDAPLLAWYEGQGYRRVRRLPDFYARGRHAWRLEKAIAAGVPRPLHGRRQ